jgi:hypothetical protein
VSETKVSDVGTCTMTGAAACTGTNAHVPAPYGQRKNGGAKYVVPARRKSCRIGQPQLGLRKDVPVPMPPSVIFSGPVSKALGGLCI